MKEPVGGVEAAWDVRLAEKFPGITPDDRLFAADRYERVKYDREGFFAGFETAAESRDQHIEELESHIDWVLADCDPESAKRVYDHLRTVLGR